MQREIECEAAKREKQLNGLRWGYRQRDNERETNKVMDMIRACAAEMQ